MKYWQLAVCISEEKEIFNKYLGNIDIVKLGREEISEQDTIKALSESNEKFLVLSNNYLRSSNTDENILKEMKCEIIEIISILEAYKRYGEKVTEVFDYGSLDLSSLN